MPSLMPVTVATYSVLIWGSLKRKNYFWGLSHCRDGILGNSGSLRTSRQVRNGAAKFHPYYLFLPSHSRPAERLERTEAHVVIKDEGSPIIKKCSFPLMRRSPNRSRHKHSVVLIKGNPEETHSCCRNTGKRNPRFKNLSRLHLDKPYHPRRKSPNLGHYLPDLYLSENNVRHPHV